MPASDDKRRMNRPPSAPAVGSLSVLSENQDRPKKLNRNRFSHEFPFLVLSIIKSSDLHDDRLKNFNFLFGRLDIVHCASVFLVGP